MISVDCGGNDGYFSFNIKELNVKAAAF